MPIAILTRFWGVAAAVVMACLLKADDANRPIVISYIGAWQEDSDPVYKRFRQAMSTRHLELSKRAVFRHYRAETGNQAMLAQALQQALGQRPTILVTPTGESAMAAAKLSSITPFVFSSFTDPVTAGIRETLQFSRRANAGVMLRGAVDGKRLEILKDAFPYVRRVAVLADRPWADVSGGSKRLAEPAAALGLTLTFVPADNAQEVDAQMSSPATLSQDAWYIPPSYIAYAAEKQIVGHLQRMKVPAMHATAGEVRAGALIAYEEDTSFAVDALADLVARVCAGERAGSIPVERPQRYKLIVRANDKPEQPLIAATVIRRADLVIRDR